MSRYKLVIAYDGTGYRGWQRQPDGKTVQETLESVFSHLFGQRVEVVGSGRTDAGVHALGQVAHVDLATAIPPDALYRALEGHLPEDIRVRDVAIVPGNFHARYDAVKRAYAYLIRHGTAPSPFFRNASLQVPRSLDIERMNLAASVLVGRHDFSAFRATGGGRTRPTRVVFVSEVFPVTSSLLCYLVVADAFLRKMVRGIVGTLLEIGTGKSDSSLMGRLLETGDRRLMGTLAPPQGLYLARVIYPKDSARG